MSETLTSTARRRGRIPGRLWAFATVAGMASFLDAAGLIGITTSLAIWQVEYDLSVWQVGIVGFAAQMCLAIGALVGGWIADRFGRQLVFNVDLALLAIGLLVVLLATDSTMLLAGIALFGLACGADIPVSLAVISDRAPESARGRLVGFTQLMWQFGIVFATAAGFAVSAMGLSGTKIIIGSIAVLAIATFIARLLMRGNLPPVVTSAPVAGDNATVVRGSALREVFRPSVLRVLVLVTVFYTFWNLVAGMLSGYTTYYLVTAADASQTLATGLSLAFIPIATVLAFVFLRIADTRWREPVFVVAGAVEVIALAIGAISGGTALLSLIIMFVLYNVTNSAAGEGIYKVWGQLLFPAQARAVAQGITFAVARVVFALFLLVAPALIAWSPAGFLWILTAFMAVAYVAGLGISRIARTHHQ
jgi:inositol transporter-like SP family MFS transporter